MTLTAAAIAALIAAAAAAATGATAQGVGTSTSNDRRTQLLNYIRSQYPNLTDEQARALLDQYGDEKFRLFNGSTWGDQTDKAGLERLMAQIDNAYNTYGERPDYLTEAELAAIQQQAYDEIDSQYLNVQNQLSQELADNEAMFGDFRNQALTNEAMRQQAIAGSTRFELDRQQRNAITRGASAAQRLVANINTQLGLQAQSAQQSLETSNVLAQNLLNHRQAQQNIRQQYLQSEQGRIRDRYNYGRMRREDAKSDRDYAQQVWDYNIDNSGLGSLGSGIYRSRYGRSNGNSGQGSNYSI